MRIFFGGTCNNSTWRNVLIPALEKRNLEFFNPVVKNWNEEARRIENDIKGRSDTVQLFVITSHMTGVFSIAEVVDASNKCPDRTVFMIDFIGFDDSEKMSLRAVQGIVKSNGAKSTDNWDHLIDILEVVCGV